MKLCRGLALYILAQTALIEAERYELLLTFYAYMTSVRNLKFSAMPFSRFAVTIPSHSRRFTMWATAVLPILEESQRIYLCFALRSTVFSTSATAMFSLYTSPLLSIASQPMKA